MVSKILKIFHRETSGLHQAAFLLGFFALLSQVLALVRDKLLAFTFGAGTNLDLYYAAFRIPDFLFVTIGSLVSLSVLIPFLMSEYEKKEKNENEQKGLADVQSFVDSVFTVFLSVILSLAFLIFLFAPFLLSYLFPGFDINEKAQVTALMRVLLLSPVLLGISNLYGSLTQSKSRFLVYSLSPLLYNVGIIFGIVLLYPNFGMVGLAWGVVIGALLHLGVQIPTLVSLNLFPKITLKPRLAYIKKLIILSFPRTITLSVSHIAIFFLLSLASLMDKGSIAIFSFAFNLQSVPLSIFGVSYSMAAFPTLSKLIAKGDKEKFREQFVASAEQILFWIVPSSVLFIVLRAHIVRIILGAGKFDWTDTRLTAAVLALFCVSLVMQALSLLFIRAMYANGSTGKPFYVTIVSGAVIMVSSYILVRLFNSVPEFRFFMEALLKISDIGGAEVTMLALGFTIGSLLEGVWIWYLFSKICRGFTRPLLSSLFRIFCASTVMGFITFSSLRFFAIWWDLSSFLGVFMQATLSGLCGIAAGVVILSILKSPELSVVLKTLHQKFWRVKVVSPDGTLV